MPPRAPPIGVHGCMRTKRPACSLCTFPSRRLGSLASAPESICLLAGISFAGLAVGSCWGAYSSSRASGSCVSGYDFFGVPFLCLLKKNSHIASRAIWPLSSDSDGSSGGAFLRTRSGRDG